MINRALKLLRTYHQLKQIDLAKRLEISNTYLSELENGDKAPSVDLLERYAATFGMPVSSIMLFAESMGRPQMRGDRVRVAAADKILRLLEWIDERDAVIHRT